MKARHIVWAAGLAIAGWLAVFGDKTPSTGVAEPLSHRPLPSKSSTAASSIKDSPTASLPVSADKAERGPNILALRARDTLIGSTHAGKQANGLFTSQTWTPLPPPLPPAQSLPPPPPTAPPLPFTYLGKKIEDKVWEVYLARGDQTFIAREQSVINDSYRIESIKPPTLSLIYLPLNQVQTLPIGDID